MSRLRNIRELNHLKQDDLATLIETSLPNYSKKENGEIRFSLVEAKRIADFFGSTIDEIFFDNDVSKNETPGLPYLYLTSKGR